MMGERAYQEAFDREVKRLHRAGAVVAVELNVAAACALVGQIQLVCRHPANRGPSRELVEELARRVQGLLEQQSPELAAGLDMGWNPVFDVPLGGKGAGHG